MTEFPLREAYLTLVGSQEGNFWPSPLRKKVIDLILNPRMNIYASEEEHHCFSPQRFLMNPVNSNLWDRIQNEAWWGKSVTDKNLAHKSQEMYHKLLVDRLIKSTHINWTKNAEFFEKFQPEALCAITEVMNDI